MDRRGLSLISIDRWGGGSQAYFLTHLHSDHTQGLCSTWRWGPLFCSRLSAKLFPLKFPGLDLSLLRVLDLGLWYSVSLVSPSSGAPTVLEVMAIDAHHCPGAVMFLFRGEFGCMLYTGDFRWEIGSKRSQRARDVLSDALRSDTMNALYLDNTYCNPSYTFPSRHVAALQIVDIIVSHPKHDIVIGIDSLGKEELLAHISRVLKIKIWVWPERLQIMHLLGYRDIFTTKTSLTRVRAVPRYSFSIETLEGLNTMRPTIGIMPSGLPWLVRPRGEESAASLPSLCRNERPTTKTRPVERIHEHIYSVPYSDHSCFCEIEDFVKLLQPIKIKGIVASSACYVNPLYYFGCGLSGENKPLRGFSQKFETKDEDGVKPKSRVAKRERESISVIRGLGGRVNRVQILRRLTRGAKIVELD